MILPGYMTNANSIRDSARRALDNRSGGINFTAWESPRMVVTGKNPALL